MNDYVADLKLLLISIVLDDPNDQIAVLNKLITNSIASIKKWNLHVR